MVEEEGSDERQQAQIKQRKKQLDKARAQLKGMLDKPVAVSKQSASHRKKGFVVFAR